MHRPSPEGEEQKEGVSPTVAQPEPEPEIELVAAVVTDHSRWSKAVDALRQVSPRHGKSLSFARFLGFGDGVAKVAFPVDAAFHRSQITGMGRQLVETELAKSLGRSVKLVEESSVQAFADAPKSIAEVEASDRSTREKGIEKKVREHPAILSLMQKLGGSIEHISYLEPVVPEKVAMPADEPEE